MIKKFFLVSIFTLLLLGGFEYTLAQNTGAAGEIDRQLQAAAEGKGAGFDKPMDPRQGLFLIIRYSLSLLGLIFTVLTLYAGFLWMTAGGDESKIGKSKSILTASVIGLGIIFLSYALTLFVFKIFLLKDLSVRRFP